MKDFYHVDPEYGTDQDLKDFVAAAQRLGLRVMLDMVFLHCGPKAVFIETHPDFIKRDKEGKVVNMNWGFPGLNFASEGLREYLWKNMEMWARDYGVDGFRCDVSDGVPLDFWETGRERLEKIRPDIGMLAEGTRKADQLKAFDLDYGWGEAFKAWDNAAAIRKLWEKMRDERPIGGAKFVRFIDNHDFANDDYDNRVEKRWGAARVEAALAALFTLDGMPLLYNGQEVADTARHSIFGRLTVDWANGETAAGKARFAFVQKLSALRKAEKALTRGGLTWLDNDVPEAVLSFRRGEGDGAVVAVINVTGQPVTVKVGGADGALAPLLAQGVSGDAQTGFRLAAYGYFVGRR
jgi:glycosidase